MQEPNPDIFQALKLVKEELILLGIAGVAGGFFRAIMAPESDKRARVVQGMGGALSALFLGGIAAHMTNSIVDGGTWSFLAWGFIMGTGGEVAVKWMQEKLMGPKK